MKPRGGPAGALLAEPWLWALLIMFGGATIAILVGPAPAIASWSTQAALYIVFTVLSWRLSTSGTRSHRSRRFWRAATVSGVIYFVAALLRTVDEIVAPGLQSTAWTAPSALFTVGSAWLLAAMLTGLPYNGGLVRRELWIDAGTVMVAAGVFIWTIALTGENSAEGAEEVVWTAVGAVILLGSAFAVTQLLVTGMAPFAVVAGVVIGIGAALHGLERALNPQVMDADDGLLVLVLRLVPPLLFAAAPALERLGPAALTVLQGRRVRVFAPLVALATTQVLLIAQLSDEGLTARSWGTAMGTVAIAGLIILRQDLLLVENARLVGQLDRTVETVGSRERWFRSLVEHASDCTVVLDRHGVVTYATPAMDPVLGRDPAASVGRPISESLHPVDPGRLRSLLAPMLAGSSATEDDEIEARRSDGTSVWLNVIATGRLDDPAVEGVVLNIRDVSDTVTLRNRLWHDASHDQLTGLANRALFNERAEALRDAGSRAVLLLDLDQFKDVNDQLGHQAGDELLRIVAQRIRHSVRPDDTVARLGGDEFSVILADTTEADAAATARRIVDTLARPVTIGAQTVHPAASVGVAVSTDKPVEALLRDADAAMYAAKRRHSGTEVYRP
ncbi:PAS domain S-box-containing protein/diguanylate cyclase (GGDEF) domain-containing protein [Asanoa hainanensis]|uniref:PAS domain S-box-containing protein/diguanylate cyclase (GGDEF) domain-containing protein n=1 Tax=Asanoa hainanensis TaxID=560556 RepID=A0A239PHE0_9ACTN|nr:sensor domain-containing diguanylate cyclase [Asanoa hainanensis]SNT66205.1 PAS domain S-box-containing protein/diguanylate cyclase (GGDEF) domain-containing protein [Asanoa hainanensis]